AKEEVVDVAEVGQADGEAGAVDEDDADDHQGNGGRQDGVVWVAGLQAAWRSHQDTSGRRSTRRRNSSPRASKFGYASKLVHAGERRTVSPGRAIAAATSKASGSVSSSCTGMPVARTASASTFRDSPKQTTARHFCSASTSIS